MFHLYQQGIPAGIKRSHQQSGWKRYPRCISIRGKTLYNGPRAENPEDRKQCSEDFIPKRVAEMLEKLKASQDEMKSILGKDYHKYDLVMATDYGLLIGEAAIRKRFKKLIKEHHLPEVVFHSLRHASVTYKLKLNGGDIKAVQGDSGHAQVNMVTDVYSHILDEDRKRNAELFEEAFYGRKNLNPQIKEQMRKSFELCFKSVRMACERKLKNENFYVENGPTLVTTLAGCQGGPVLSVNPILGLGVKSNMHHLIPHVS